MDDEPSDTRGSQTAALTVRLLDALMDAPGGVLSRPDVVALAAEVSGEDRATNLTHKKLQVTIRHLERARIIHRPGDQCEPNRALVLLSYRGADQILRRLEGADADWRDAFRIIHTTGKRIQRVPGQD